MNWKRTSVAVVCAVGVIVAVMQLSGPNQLVNTTHTVSDGVPVTILIPETAAETEQTIPGIVVAHGFAGSRRMMLGHGYTFASAGFAVALLDFSGHGANPGRLPADSSQSSAALQSDIEEAVGVLLRQRAVDPDRIGILGHSMGSGAAMSAAISMPDLFKAVVAVSPTNAAVTENEPQNLLLQAGAWEPRFLENARRLLEQAGGRQTEGNRRAFQEIANVEHITIVYANQSHELAAAWFGESLGGLQSISYRDQRLLWYGILIAGIVGLLLSCAPLMQKLSPSDPCRGSMGLPALRGGRATAFLFLSPALAGLITGGGALLFYSFSGRILPPIFGLSVGGFVGVWVALLGMLWLIVGVRPAPPRIRSLLLGMCSFAVLWLFVGMAGQQVLFQWLLVPYRLIRWPILALCSFPWLLAAGYVHCSATPKQRIGLYLGQTVSVVVVLALHGVLVPGLFFLVLLLPLLPIVLLVMQTVGGVWDDPWAYAVGNALFFGWLLAAVFPLQ
jgi:dienelactone hydrolase